MQTATWLSNAADYLWAEWAQFVAQATVWSDRIYGSGYGPLAEAAILTAGAAAAALCLTAYTNDKDVEVWSALGVAGRWMGGVAVVVATLAALAHGRLAA